MLKLWTKRLAPTLFAIAATVALTPSSHAGLVSYTTQGAFNGAAPSDASSETFNYTGGFSTETITLGFAGRTSLVSVTAPTDTSLGTFTATDGGRATVSGDLSTTHFTLTVNQTVPTSDVGTSTATINGSYGYFIGAGSTNFSLAFDSNTFTIGYTTYALEIMNPPNILRPSAPPTYTLLSAANPFTLATPVLGNSVSVQLYAHVISTPEPSTIASAGLGVLVFGGAWYRRRRRGPAA